MTCDMVQGKDELPEWTTYKVDRQGRRLPRNEPPPQGTYKVRNGMFYTDYSDPRDFYAPMEIDQFYVWKALRPTRQHFAKVTGLQLNVAELNCLSLGYNASYDELRRLLWRWIFKHYGSGRKCGQQQEGDIHHFIEASAEIPGYATVGTKRMPVTPGPMDSAPPHYFQNGELSSFETPLFKLRRWYGLVEDYHFAPNWPRDRSRNKLGHVIQNRECFACKSCVSNEIFCHGHKEHVDRKCKPCELLKLTCSKEVSESNTLPPPAHQPADIEFDPRSRFAASVQPVRVIPQAAASHSKAGRTGVKHGSTTVTSKGSHSTLSKASQINLAGQAITASQTMGVQYPAGYFRPVGPVHLNTAQPRTAFFPSMPIGQITGMSQAAALDPLQNTGRPTTTVVQAGRFTSGFQPQLTNHSTGPPPSMRPHQFGQRRGQARGSSFVP